MVIKTILIIIRFVLSSTVGGAADAKVLVLWLLAYSSSWLYHGDVDRHSFFTIKLNQQTTANIRHRWSTRATNINDFTVDTPRPLLPSQSPQLSLVLAPRIERSPMAPELPHAALSVYPFVVYLPVHLTALCILSRVLWNSHSTTSLYVARIYAPLLSLTVTCSATSRSVVLPPQMLLIILMLLVIFGFS